MPMQSNLQAVSSTRVDRHAVRPASPAHALNGPIEILGAPTLFPRNGEIYGEGEPADCVFKVLSGTVRTFNVLADGRRQIGSFYLAGDVFGLEIGEEHAFSAEAITESTVLVIRRSALVALAARDGAVARELWTLTGRELARVQEHILLLVKTAQERVASFLLEMAARRPTGDTVELPMTRQDIADYLGLTIETVSRTLTSLENEAAIALANSRRIVLRNRLVLREMNAGSRIPSQRRETCRHLSYPPSTAPSRSTSASQWRGPFSMPPRTRCSTPTSAWSAS